MPKPPVVYLQQTMQQQTKQHSEIRQDREKVCFGSKCISYNSKVVSEGKSSYPRIDPMALLK